MESVVISAGGQRRTAETAIPSACATSFTE